jgi:hypothetical protein
VAAKCGSEPGEDSGENELGGGGNGKQGINLRGRP